MTRIAPLLAIALFVLGAGSLTAGDFPSGSPAFKTNYDEALKASKASGKPILVVFSATWCPPCQANKKNVYPSAEVKEHHDKFVWAYLDTDVKSNAQVAKKFGVRGIPHIQFVNKDGEAIDKVVGGTRPKTFARKLASVAKKAK